jgi:ATP-dependent helicase/nuclease subunit A
MKRDDASERQVQAADPVASTWLSANAGSGKTKVLIDRVARLLLSGVKPQHILCLTYTKAAAAEMQNRLFQRLGKWAMMPNEALYKELQALGEDPQMPKRLPNARQLFAAAIDTPGGLRIQTIHSFCAMLLRRFPLEAGVTPQFVELDERAGRLLRDAIVQDMADTLAPDVIAGVARAYTGEDFAKLMDETSRVKSAFATPMNLADCKAVFNVPESQTRDSLLDEVFLGGEAHWLPQLATIMDSGSVTDIANAKKIRAMRLYAPSHATLDQMEDLFLTGEGAKAPFSAKLDSVPTKPTQPKLGPLHPRLQDLMRRVEASRPKRLALLAAEKTAALHQFAAIFLPEYDRRKALRGFLDFDDLISRTRDLLTSSGVAQWVLFRLDGGIAHILVDEAQDTSPDQWKVIERLADEFTAGQGAYTGPRTLFVVGDKKQSIYSFQGADVAVFEQKKDDFSKRLSDSGSALVKLDLEYSFRSSPAILRLVDFTFDERRKIALGGNMKHHAFNADLPGWVELLPVVEAGDKAPLYEWENPVDLVTSQHHAVRLAANIAKQIKTMIDSGQQIPVKGRNPVELRPVHAGDFLILVQRRNTIFTEIIRACKKLDLPIAGADRLKLGGELAVKDLAALLSFLATPEDDLSLAVILRSPLCGWTEAQLYDLAQGRDGYLWQALRGKGALYPQTIAMLTDLRDQTDYLRPFDLLERALTRHDGRRKLIARLGAEAEDGIDELLSQSLAYERNDVPSLTGFLGWLQTDNIDVKRQMESEGTKIRVMTVHGAKGLEAPIVILPDTADRKPQDRDEIYRLGTQGPAIWKTAKEDSPAAALAERVDREARRAAESLRLLYVAMTRAQSILIVAAGGEVKSPEAWYNIIQGGMLAVGATALPSGSMVYGHGDLPSDPKPPKTVPEATILPTWASIIAPEAARTTITISPSNLGGAKALSGDEGMDEDAALSRGHLLHLLLEQLPTAAPGDWPAMASSLVPDPVECANLLAEASGVLQSLSLAHLFAPGTLAEVPVSAQIGTGRLYGVIDRLIITKTHVLAVDYKSNRVVPTTAAAVPEGLLRQMGAYAHALEQIYPTHQIDTAILWTAVPNLMPLDRDIVREALSRATIP